MNWSGGKDSALALYDIQQSKQFEIAHLVTTINAAVNRISMHGVRYELLEAQSNALNIPIFPIYLPDNPTMSSYEEAMRSRVEALREFGLKDCVFGDIFLEDLRAYREKQLNTVGIQAHFPLWKQPTAEVIRRFLDLGFKTMVVCVDNSKLDETFVGRTIDSQFIDNLPDDVDPCGENGEFHTFVYDGPNFNTPIAIELGEKVFREMPKTSEQNDVCSPTTQEAHWGFWYQDIRLKTT